MSYTLPSTHPRSCSTSCPAGSRLRGRRRSSRAPSAGCPWYCATRCPTPRTPHRPRWCPNGPLSCSTGTPTPRTQVGGRGRRGGLPPLAPPTSTVLTYVCSSTFQSRRRRPTTTPTALPPRLRPPAPLPAPRPSPHLTLDPGTRRGWSASSRPAAPRPQKAPRRRTR